MIKLAIVALVCLGVSGCSDYHKPWPPVKQAAYDVVAEEFRINSELCGGNFECRVAVAQVFVDKASYISRSM